MAENPTVGRIVHFYDPDKSKGQPEGPYAAVITRVDDTGHVHLTAFLPHGAQAAIPVGGILHRDSRPDDAPACPYWVWPPRA